MDTEPLRGPWRARALMLAAFAAMGLGGCTPKAEPPAPVARNLTLTAAQREHIRLYAVSSGAFSRTVEATGVVDFDNDQATSVLAPFSGPVTRLLVQPGDLVRKGQPLAMVESPDFAAAVAGYRKAMATAQTTQKLAEADRDLLAHNGISQREALQADTDAANAAADRDAALQALASLDVDPATLRDLQAGRPVAHVEGVIRAPIAGTVAEKLITPGQLLQAGATPAFTVADLSRVWVMAQIPDADLASVHVGDTAEVQNGAAARGVSGTVDNLSAVVNPDTRAVLARVVVANPGDLLKKQMYVRVRIHARAPSAGLLAPTSAVLRDDENLAFVYVALADGAFARRHVTLGDRTGDQYEIADGLKSGDRIVVDGALFLQFMESQ
ncbi:efflux RND transporter periplasmic adaptor subunit [Phenylobacterium aquaticum]|uniref:efflux RND transporter periplasmic adaptor subunit n=1 Tax=Phenylobacterium aquaticum TaxID=1763816 RepID=UPI0026F13D91|nr:efflux RND transporter periplasmic adaptor subunit [Phenylobacterium aquaticum]